MGNCGLYFNGEIRAVDIATLLYLLATVGIFIGTIKALRISQEMARGQARAAFEGTFFQMLNLHHEIVRGLSKTTSSGVPNVGRAVLSELSSYLVNRLVVVWRDEMKKSPGDRAEERGLVEQVFMQFFEPHQAWLGHYYHTIYHVLVHVDRHGEADRIWYTKVLRAQLSTPELVLLFYYGVSEPGRKLKALMEQYGMLEDLPADRLAGREHREYYAMSAYQAP